MSTYERMKVRKIEGKPYTPYEVFVPKSVTGTRRVRKYFSSAEDGNAYIVRVRQKGFANADIRDSGRSAGSATVSEYSAMWLSRNSKKGASTRRQLNMVIRSLEDAVGRMGIEEVTHRELESWLAGVRGGHTTKKNHHRVARRFFRWCQEWLEVIPRNPMIKVDRPAGIRNPIQILPPERMADCLKVAKMMADPDGIRILGYLCLGGFAGLRTEEVLRQFWQDIDWKSGEIYVRNPKKVNGWKPRYVEILPALRRNLKSVAQKQGKVFPGGQRALYLARRELMDVLAWDVWPSNCLRHSYKTYHCAKFQNPEKTKNQMGHSDEQMTGQYGTPEARRVASDWWKL